MTGLRKWLGTSRELPGPLRYLDIFKLRRFITVKRVVVALCSLVLLHTVFNVWSYLALEKELGAARSAGIELNMRKHNKEWPDQGENAAPLYLAAFELLSPPKGQGGDEAYPDTGKWPATGPPSETLVREMSRFTSSERTDVAFKLIERANAMPRCNWGLRYEETFQMVLPHLNGVRRAASALLVRARLRYVNEDSTGALSDLEAVLVLAERIDSDELIISKLFQYSVLDLWLTALGQMSNAQRFDADALLKLQTCLARWEQLIGTTQAFETEAAAAYTWSEEALHDPKLLAQNFRTGLWSWGWTARLATSSLYRPMYRLDQKRMLGYELELVELSREPYYMAKDRLNRFDAEIASCSKVFFLTRLLLPALPKTQVIAARKRAEVRTAQVGLALQAYRERTNTDPASLAGLVPAYLPQLPVDPFTGKGLHYVHAGSEVVVYSVGKNGRDDGGLTEAKDQGKTTNPGTDDIAWRVAR
jgi:hypothetical protein